MTQRADALDATLARLLAGSVLPGDDAHAAPDMAQVAAFVLDAALTRQRGCPAVNIETVSGRGGGAGAVGKPGGRRFMRIAVINDDMPFLVDSVASSVLAHGHLIDRLVHPVLAVHRDAQGQLVAFGATLPGTVATPGAMRESIIYIETRRADARGRAALAAALRVTLGDVGAAVADWPAMRCVMADDATRLAAAGRPEGAALLRWFEGDMLTQLGHLVRRRDGRQEQALGICRKSAAELISADSYKRAFAWFDDCIARGGDGLWPLAIKSNRIANVHRRVPLDLFLVPIIEGGEMVALSVHAGVWTSAALAAPPMQVPRLRSQLASLMERHGFIANGHAGKALVHALTKLPHDLLISFADADLERVALTMMSLIDRPRPCIALVAAPLERHLFAFVWLPRDAYSGAVRLEVTAMLGAATGAPLLDWSLEIEGSGLAQLLFVFDIREGGRRDRNGHTATGARPDEAALDARLQAMLRGWADAVEAELAAGDEGPRATAIAMRYAEAFPPAYRSLYGAAEAAIDLSRLRHLATDGDNSAPLRGVRLNRLSSDAERRFRLKVYQRHGVTTLSGAVPALENFGFQVIDTIPTVLALGHEELGTIHDFLLALPAGCDAGAIAAHTGAIEAAMAAVANNSGENDVFNRLIVAVGLVSEEAGWLRAWYRYLRQVGMGFGIGTVVDALVAAPQVTRGLVALFRAGHQPGIKHRAEAQKGAEQAIREGLGEVSAINDDRLLRAFRGAVLAILRTNAFAPAGSGAGETPLAFKFDCVKVPGLPKPLPWREIFVYSQRVEGIHLRAGPVARGGIRWSDRRDDFRTEVLGLMKAQRVKNAVIVPTGAKGGFYPKQLPDPLRDRDSWAAEGRASYQAFIRALLSVTDNIVDGQVVHPAGVVIHDGNERKGDPYFVVAADKGTASFSDTANQLAAEASFWLDDAFASGGSKGYDHKAMGITARGAWLSVQRHFSELGTNIQTEPVRVVGVGDMSGDVFGNGMLLSKALKLVAAFDHRHIFLDPDPDPAQGWAERARLFALVRSSWADYDPALISQGGGVFSRGLKQIPLSDEVRAVLGLSVATIDPDELIRAILAAPVDLLWFGGIGTYVRASHEGNGDVGDPANDAVRIVGAGVRARVIGEGANLGCTQAARIEYALRGAGGSAAGGHGGRINTDFIDNSAGVDCSDKEVNIKIALASAKRAGRLGEAARVALLARMTDGVAALVLEDNRLQALGLSIAEAGGAAELPSAIRLIETLEEGGHLDRATDGLADNETLTRRARDVGNGGPANGTGGLTRPELAVLLSSTKLVIQDALEQSAVPDDPGLEAELLGAFPEPMREPFAQDIRSHRLCREIIATRLANRLVNRLGFIRPFELAEEEGVGLADIARAFIAAEQLFGMAGIWRRIEDMAMPEATRIMLFERAAHGLCSHMADLLRAGLASTPPLRLAADLAAGLGELSGATDQLLSVEAATRSAGMRADLAAAGVPAGLAAEISHLFDLDGAVGLARLARDSDTSAVLLTHAFTTLGSSLGLDWAQATAARMAPSDRWDRLLVSGLARDFQQMRLDFIRRLGGAGTAPDSMTEGAEPQARVETWLATNHARVRQLRAVIERARAQSPVTPSMLAQIASQARNLLAR